MEPLSCSADVAFRFDSAVRTGAGGLAAALDLPRLSVAGAA